MGNLATPASVQKLQTALHSLKRKKGSAESRFYALYDKIAPGKISWPMHPLLSAARIKGAPGVDGQDFPDVVAYEVERWLGELAIALKEETYRQDPIR